MTFRENLNRICKEKGTNLTRMVKELGISSSKVTAINKGSIPSEEMLLNFAKHLDCSVMDFFYDKEDDEDRLTEPITTDEDLKDLIRIYNSLSRRTKHEFMSMVYEFENRKELEGDKESASAI